MNKIFEVFSDVLRIATLQPGRSYRNLRDYDRFEAPARFRSERRGDERFFG